MVIARDSQTEERPMPTHLGLIWSSTSQTRAFRAPFVRNLERDRHQRRCCPPSTPNPESAGTTRLWRQREIRRLRNTPCQLIWALRWSSTSQTRAFRAPFVRNWKETDIRQGVALRALQIQSGRNNASVTTARDPQTEEHPMPTYLSPEMVKYIKM